MAFALEILIVPVLLISVTAIFLAAGEVGPGTAIAGAIGLAVLFFVVINLLRTARREEDEEGEDQAARD